MKPAELRRKIEADRRHRRIRYLTKYGRRTPRFELRLGFMQTSYAVQSTFDKLASIVSELERTGSLEPMNSSNTLKNEA